MAAELGGGAGAAASRPRLTSWMERALDILAPAMQFGSYAVHHANGQPKILEMQFKFTSESFADFERALTAVKR